MARQLIVNADDFGLSPGVNRGIAEAFELGIVTSASLLVHSPAAAPAAEYARRNPRLSVGLHFDLGEWELGDDGWQLVYEVASRDDAAAVGAELERQLAAFRALVGRDPTHLDSHQHVHRSEPARSLLAATASELGIVLRGFDAEVRYRGEFYGRQRSGSEPYPDGISVEALLRLLSGLTDGCTEMSCHPANCDDFTSKYCAERAIECGTLCDPRIRAAIATERIDLCAFAPAAASTCGRRWLNVPAD